MKTKASIWTFAALGLVGACGAAVLATALRSPIPAVPPRIDAPTMMQGTSYHPSDAVAVSGNAVGTREPRPAAAPGDRQWEGFALLAAANAAEPAPTVISSPLVGEWPCIYGPTQDADSPETDVVTTWPEAGPPELWRIAVGAGYSAPVVSKGRLFLFHRIKDEEIVERLDAVTGKSQWKHGDP
ncbi:MAG: hypothetical protein ACRDD1_02135, partial [Planctomycetia bacterium]